MLAASDLRWALLAVVSDESLNRVTLAASTMQSRAGDQRTLFMQSQPAGRPACLTAARFRSILANSAWLRCCPACTSTKLPCYAELFAIPHPGQRILMALCLRCGPRRVCCRSCPVYFGHRLKLDAHCQHSAGRRITLGGTETNRGWLVL
jgi:hypothetical protein